MTESRGDGGRIRRFTLPVQTRTKFRPAAGRDFSIEQIAASDQYETSRTRDHIAKLMLWGGASALAAALVVSIISHSFSPLGAVWAVVGPFAGGIVTYYFYRDPKR